ELCVRIDEQQREAVAADPKISRKAAEAVREPLGKFHENGVASRIPEACVDGLEAIEVEQCKARILQTRTKLLQLFHQRDTISKSCQGIPQSAFELGCVGLLARRDVGDKA